MSEDPIDDRIRAMFARMIPAHLPTFIDDAMRKRFAELSGVQALIDEQMVELRGERDRFTQGINNAITVFSKRAESACDAALLKHEGNIKQRNSEALTAYLTKINEIQGEQLGRLTSSRRWGRFEGFLVAISIGGAVWYLSRYEPPWVDRLHRTFLTFYALQK
jgi:hypothetical protein